MRMRECKNLRVWECENMGILFTVNWIHGSQNEKIIEEKMKSKQEQIITKEMTIGEVVSRYPSIAEIIMDNGVHCIGCGGAFMETIEQGFKGHGMNDAEVNRIVDEMNESLHEQGVLGSPTTDGITITKKAAKKLKEMLHEKKKENWGLRVEVTPGGCAGYSYGMDIEKKEKSNDQVIEQEGVKLFIDNESYPLIKGATIDYIDALQGAGFKIKKLSEHSPSVHSQF